ncbi:MAG: thiamine-phosphate kinase [Candidatus Krumholzibacteria bacterium]
MARVLKTGEHVLLQSFRRMLAARRVGTRGVVVGVGDDTAVLRPRAGQDLLFTTDVQVEGRHFERDWLSGFDLGWRLAAVNLSDIAAMGGVPLYALVALALPENLDLKYVKSIERGVRDHLAAWRATVVGGNVSGIDDTIVCDLTLIGSCARGKAWKRNCRPNLDAVVVVGNLGDAAAGYDVLARGRKRNGRGKIIRAFRKPRPLLDVARLLTGEKAVHGAIDVSDGFSSDLIHICEGGDAGVEVDSRQLPLSKALHNFCKASGGVPLRYAMDGGEDYALILSVDAKRAEVIANKIEDSTGVTARVVGRFTARKGAYYLLGERGRRTRIVPGGWDHLARGAPEHGTPKRG